MKKILFRIGIAIVALIAIALIAVTLLIDTAVKRGVETVGPKLTQVTVKLDGASVSLLSGSGSIKGLDVGNPEGFKSSHALQVGSASLSLKPTSLLGDKVVIRSINLEAPEVTLEGSLQGNNLSTIRDNVQAATAGKEPTPTTPEEEKAASRKLQVDDFKITGAKLNLIITELGGKTYSLTLAPIHLANLGSGPEGITSGELTQRVLTEIEKQAVAQAREFITELAKSGALEEVNKAAGGALDKAGKGIQDLLKR